MEWSKLGKVYFKGNIYAAKENNSDTKYLPPISLETEAHSSIFTIYYDGTVEDTFHRLVYVIGIFKI